LDHVAGKSAKAVPCALLRWPHRGVVHVGTNAICDQPPAVPRAALGHLEELAARLARLARRPRLTRGSLRTSIEIGACLTFRVNVHTDKRTPEEEKEEEEEAEEIHEEEEEEEEDIQEEESACSQ